MMTTVTHATGTALTQDAIKLLAHLHKGGSFAYFWTNDHSQSKWFPCGDYSKLPTWFDGNHNVYFVVNPQLSIPETNGRGEPKPPELVAGRNELVHVTNTLYAEFDGKDEVEESEYYPHLPANFADLAAVAQRQAIKAAQEAVFYADPKPYLARAFARIDRAPLFPSVIVFSGGGYHCYWLLENTVMVNDDNRARIAELQKAWIDLVGGDKSAVDLKRVLRVPGTYNCKAGFGNNHPLVKVDYWNESALYALAQFEQLTGIDEAYFTGLATPKVKRESSDAKDDVIGEYNRKHSIVDLLTSHRYTLAWDKPAMARLSRPGRDKDQTSVIVFRENGKESSYHHSSNDALHNGHCHDAFAIFQQLDHNGDFAAAFEAAKREQGKWVEAAHRRQGSPTLTLRGDTMTTTTIDLFKYRAEDGGILDCWLEIYGNDWLYVAGFESWYWWTGTHWEKDEAQRLYKQLQDLMHAMNRAAISEMQKIEGDDDKARAQRARLREFINATKRSRARVASVEGMAQAHRAIAADRLNTLNALNLANGTLDLDKIELRPHDRRDFLTYRLGYEYSADALAPRFENFMREVFVADGTTNTDEELCQLVQEALGYSLTTDTRQEAMFWLDGDGGNGKTVLITIIHWLLNGMAASVDFSTLGQPGNYDLADAQGKRVLFSTESERGGRLAEGYIKRIVSGERINARAIYGKPFEFRSIAKLWWAMNDKPVIKDTGNSVWRRLKLIPFNRTFSEAERDPDLLDKLKPELPGILNFAITGLQRLRLRGRLPEAAAVAAAIKEYRHESNPVAQWLEENTVKLTQFVTTGKTLYADYERWCTANGRQAMNSVHWGRELTRLKAESKTTNSGRMFAIGILQPEEATAQ